MTWAKYGTEYFDQLAEYDFPPALDDACQLTHTQVLHYLYSTEDLGAAFLKKNLRRIASSTRCEEAAAELVTAGAWADRGNKYEIVHHVDVFRQSLGYQLREREKAAGRKRNQRAREKEGGPDGPPGGSDVTGDVTRDVLRTQTDSQSDIQPGQSSSSGEALNFNPTTGEVLDALPSSALSFQQEVNDDASEVGEFDDSIFRNRRSA